MTDTPEQPETLLKFPCDFPIKVVGQQSDDFEIAVLSIIRKHLPDFSENAYQSRPSKQGKYLALTITVHVTSKEQLDNIYRDLSSSPHILMAL